MIYNKERKETKMKSQKGITLISLTVYIIVMVIVVAIISVISTYFYTNVDSISNTINPMTEYTKFNSFFSDEVNHSNIKVLECKGNYIVFDNGVQYTFLSENKGIYRNKVKIASDVESCTFEYKIKNGKNVVGVSLQIGTAKERSIEYTLKN